MDDIKDTAAMRQAAILEAARKCSNAMDSRRPPWTTLRARQVFHARGFTFISEQASLVQGHGHANDRSHAIKHARRTARQDARIDGRILEAFDAMFSEGIGSENLDELFTAMLEMVGMAAFRETENEFASDPARGPNCRCRCAVEESGAFLP